MEEQQVVAQNPKKQKKNIKLVIFGLTFFVLLILTFISYKAFMYRSNLAIRTSEIESLKGQLASATATVESAPSDLVGEPDKKCSGGSSYEAAIGKFMIAMDDPHVIIRDLDGGFEGGPVTSLEIGRCIKDQQNVVDTPPAGEVKILAHAASSSADLKAAYESRNGTLTSDGTVMIAGVTAQKYKLEALFSTTVIYYDNSGVGYEIELSDTNTTTNATLQDIISDWAFTP